MDKRTISLVKLTKKYSDSKGDDAMLFNLAEYLLKTPKVTSQPPFLEIGTRRGGSALLMLKIIEKKFPHSVLMTIDPYGDKPYDDKPWKYGSKFYKEMKRLLSPFGNHIHYHMTSADFIKILDKINYWYDGKKRNFSNISFAFLDGSHIPKTVKMEFNNLFPRLIHRGYMIVDNTDYYKDHMKKYFEKLASKNKNNKVISSKHQSIIQKVA